MTSIEFAVVLGWLLLPPLVLASIGLVAVLRGGTTKRKLQAWCALLALSMFFSIVITNMPNAGLGYYFGVQDRPFMWAPFTLIAVALAFPFAVCVARRGVQR